MTIVNTILNKEKVERISLEPSWGWEGVRCLQGNLWYSPPASMTSRLASVTLKMLTKCSS